MRTTIQMLERTHGITNGDQLKSIHLSIWLAGDGFYVAISDEIRLVDGYILDYLMPSVS